jgi:hypothetical protein
MRATKCYDEFIQRFIDYVNRESRHWPEPRKVTDVTRDIIAGIDNGSGKSPFPTERETYCYPSSWSFYGRKRLWDFIDSHPKLVLTQEQVEQFDDALKSKYCDEHAKCYNKTAVYSRSNVTRKTGVQRVSDEPNTRNESREHFELHKDLYTKFLRRLNRMVFADLKEGKIEEEIDIKGHFHKSLHYAGLHTSWEKRHFEPDAYINRPPKWMEELYPEVVSDVLQVLEIKHLVRIKILDGHNVEFRETKAKVDKLEKRVAELESLIRGTAAKAGVIEEEEDDGNSYGPGARQTLMKNFCREFVDGDMFGFISLEEFRKRYAKYCEERGKNVDKISWMKRWLRAQGFEIVQNEEGKDGINAVWKKSRKATKR